MRTKRMFPTSITRRPLACLLLLAFALVATPASRSEASVLVGSGGDTVRVDEVITNFTPQSVHSSPASSPVDSINMSGLDCSGFPLTCTYIDVLDPNGFPVGNLTADSFCVYQDGNPIDTFTVQQLSVDSCFISVCLVVDVSGSMADDHKIDSAKAAMHRFVSNMDAFDRVAIVTFSNCVNTQVPFTSDTTVLQTAITGLTAGGNTACFDGIWQGVDVTIGELGTKAVIAFTDGLENRSQSCFPPPDGVNDASYADDSTLICNHANASGIPIYTFNLGPIDNTFFNPEALQAFATGTGGAWAHAPSGADIDSLYTQIKKRLCSRYYICYQSLDTIQNGDTHVTKVCHYNAGTDSCGPCDSAACQERDVPKIVRTPPTLHLGDTCQSTDNSLSLCVYVKDADTDPDSLTVRLFYRTQAGSYGDVPMVLQVDDSTFCYTIPASQLKCKDFVEYYITASDGVSTVSNPAQNPQTQPYHIDLCPKAPAICPGDSVLTVCALAPIKVPGFYCPNGTSSVVGGTLSGDTVTIASPVVGPNLITFICADTCGADTCQVTVTVNITPAADAMCPGNSQQTVCSPGQVQPVPGFTFAFGVPTVIGGTLNAGSVTITSPVFGPNLIKLICTGPCGADTCQTTVTINPTPPPDAMCPGNSVQTVCSLGQVQPVPGFTFTNGVPTVQGGTLNAGSVTLTSPVVGPNVITLICTGPCGADTCQTTVTINLTPAADAMCPGNAAQTVCNLNQVQPVPGFSFANGVPTVIGGTLNAGSVTLTNPVVGPNLIKLICTGPCGADTCQSTVTIALSNQVSCPDVPDSTTVRVCEISEYCLNLGSAQGITCQVIAGPGTVSGDQWCYTPASLNETAHVTLQCTDECQNSCQTSFVVAFHSDSACGDCPLLSVDTLTAIPNSMAEVCIRVQEGGLAWGGFDFLLQYDFSVITLVGVEPGSFLVDCGWEYFTYRLLGSGKVRIIAIADMNNSNHHPLCLSPGPGDVIACLKFRITNDWTLACRDALIQWYWMDCADNSISNPLGDTLYIASSAPGSVVNWEGTDLTGLGALGGPPFPCPSDKGHPVECPHFEGGKIRVICPGEIDDRGDLNLNAIAYEISDAVLYSQYFIHGPSVFVINLDGQTAASDVNNDGVTLTVADLVYLIRVITGDARPIADNGLGPKVGSGIVGAIDVSTSQQGSRTTVSVSSKDDMGAALFIFDAAPGSVQEVSRTSRSQDMDLSYAQKGSELRVLLYNIEGRRRMAAGSGELLNVATKSGSARLRNVEAATFDGGALETHLEAKVVPQTFALHENHPNPFNPSTSFSIDFPTATDYRLCIYNIAGQVVRKFTGHAQAGTVQLEWDGFTGDGRAAASGVYFYAVDAGPFSAVRKMVLMK